MTENTLWVDMINPSDVLFFESFIFNLSPSRIFVSLRNRAETVDLARKLHIEGESIGSDYRNSIEKVLGMISRMCQLSLKVSSFDYALSFENGMSVVLARLRKKKSILFCDNDLKFLQKNFFQDLETKFKAYADYIIVPEMCSEIFKSHIKNDEKIVSYNGYKEHVYIANFEPDPKFKSEIPYESFVVIRPEATGSFYVKERRSIVPELLKLFRKENINIVYLPREKGDVFHAKGYNVYIPGKVLSGLDFCYFSDAVLTGSGTMAREAACMGKKSISFFPSKTLLSVDRQLVEKGEIFHSRDPKEIVGHVLSLHNKSRVNLERCKRAREEVVKITMNIIQES
jgi:predicted glycosyltransferase